MRPGKALEEMARVMADGNWYTVSYLGSVAGQYVRPEVAWRAAHCSGRKGSVQYGRKRLIRDKLHAWLRIGWVERQSLVINGRSWVL